MPHARTAADLPVAIVGAGFSGSLLAINLLRHGARVALVEREQAQLAKGLAFGTRRPEHLLNVRAANMSAFPDDLDHFRRWMRFSIGDEANRFVSRLAYGHYLRELLVDALAEVGGRAELFHGEARTARFEDGGVTLVLADGTELRCRALVLAMGNFPPAPHPALENVPSEFFLDPYQPEPPRGAASGPEGHIVLVGSGLTAIDAILSLDRAGYAGRFTALSRRGLRPHSHALAGPDVSPVPAPQESGSWLVRRVRERAEAVGWRAAVDELRPHTQHLWRRHGFTAQRRFLRHLRPWWDIHRHRLAPEVSARVATLEAEGRLAFVAGKLVGATSDDDRVQLAWRPRGETQVSSLHVDRLVNCAGPDGDLARTTDPLLRSLCELGQVRPDAHGLGLDVGHSGRVRDVAGGASDLIFAVGPMTKGEAWEIVAVPDIRRQVWHLARYLANAHWVGGEGL